MKSKYQSPPALASRFLVWFLKEELAEEVSGDLEEKYQVKLEETSVFRARLHYCYQVSHYLRPFALRKNIFTHSNPLFMFRHNLKISKRILLKDKGYSLLNIGGLALGMTVALLIGLWLWDELSFNRYHTNYDRIVQIKRSGTSKGRQYVSDWQVSALGNLLKSDYINHFENVVMARRPEGHIISSTERENSFTEIGTFIGAEAPEMLSLKMLAGSHDGLFDKNAILLSASLAKKLFGAENPMSQSLEIDEHSAVKVAGVYEDLPNNSSFREAAFMAPIDLFFTHNGSDPNAWSNFNLSIYAQLLPDTDLAHVNTVIKGELYKHMEEAAKESQLELFLHPMPKWHLYSTFENGVSVASDQLKAVWFNGIIGAFVLFLACINFMNLSTARSEKRAREIGVRKSMGSIRRQLINQFLSESLLVASFAFILAIVMTWLILPWFNQVADKEMAILWTNPLFWLGCLSFTLITGLLAGSYPAFYLSSFNPVKALKGSFRGKRSASLSRKVLVVFQFTTSIALIIGTIIVYEQIQFAKDRPVGYTREGLLMLPKQTADLYGKFELFKTELKKTGTVAEMAQANYPITNTRGSNDGFDWDGRDPGFDPSFNTIKVSPEYGATVDWEIVAGRGFSSENRTDSDGVVINEAAAKLLDFDDPIGKQITFSQDYFGGPNFQILGVVKDMIKDSPFEPAVPSLMFLSEGDLPWFFIKIRPEVSLGDALPKIEKAFKTLVPTAPFDFYFVDEDYAAKFRSEEQISKIASFFAILAIFISCLGLFGLAAYVAERRTKEVSIRKVLGASSASIWQMLSKDLMLLVLVACFIAIPIAYYFIQGWLQNYTYRIDVPFWVFLLVGFGALLITLLTVSFQAIRAALANPVKSLRSE